MMDLETARNYCLAQPGKITERCPFGDDVLVFFLYDKCFALISLNEHPTTINLKCDPDKALELRELYDSVRPGYHMNKKHWNTVILDGSIPDKEIRSMIDHSHQCVAKKLGPIHRKKVFFNNNIPKISPRGK